MATSEAQICNIALSHVGVTDTPIANLETDTGHIATQCRIHYDIARRFVLADTEWSFSIAGPVALASLTGAPQGWQYRYAMPEKCLRVLEITRETENGDEIPFKVVSSLDFSSRNIITNEYQAKASYIYDVDNVSLFTPGFETAFGWYLAASLAMPITRDDGMRRQALEMYEYTMNAGSRQNAKEAHSDYEPDASWVSEYGL